MSLKYFGIEVVRLGHVQVRYDVLVALVLQHVAVEADVVEVLIILLMLKVVDYCQLGRIVLQ